MEFKPIGVNLRSQINVFPPEPKLLYASGKSLVIWDVEKDVESSFSSPRQKQTLLGFTTSQDVSTEEEDRVVTIGAQPESIELVCWRYSKFAENMLEEICIAKPTHNLKQQPGALDLSFSTQDPSLLACSLFTAALPDTQTDAVCQLLLFSLKDSFVQLAEFNPMEEVQSKGGDGGSILHAFGCWLPGRPDYVVFVDQLALVYRAVVQGPDVRGADGGGELVATHNLPMALKDCHCCTGCEENGRVIIASRERLFHVDFSGKIIRTLKGPCLKSFFADHGGAQNLDITCMCTLGTSVLVGTSGGSIFKATANNLMWEDEIFSDSQHFRYKFTCNYLPQSPSDGIGKIEGLASSLESFSQILPLKNGSYLAVLTKSQCIAVLHSRTKRQLAIRFGHFGPITQALFHPSIDNVLLTASKDQTIYVWDLKTKQKDLFCAKVVGLLDIPSTISSALSFDQVRNSKSNNDSLAVTCLLFLDLQSELFCGCCNGLVQIFSADFNSAPAANLQHQKPEPRFSLKYSVDACEVFTSFGEGKRSVQDIDLSVTHLGYAESALGEGILCICYASGWVGVTHRMTAFQGGYCIQVENLALLASGNPSETMDGESGSGVSYPDVHLLTSHRRRSRHVMHRRRMTPWAFLEFPTEGGFNWEQLDAKPCAQYRLDGAALHASVHPSKQFLHVLTQNGMLLTYSLWTCELKSLIYTGPIPASTFAVDPSGLYIACVCILQHGSLLTSPSHADLDEQMEEDVSSTSQFKIFELLSGMEVESVAAPNPKAVHSMDWSPYGAFIMITPKEEGIVQVLPVPQHILATIDLFMQESRSSSCNFFWLHAPWTQNIVPKV